MKTLAILLLVVPWAFVWMATAEPGLRKDPLPIPEKLVVLTFDDGNVSDLTTVAPILKEHGFGATFFITSGWVGGQKRLTWPQVLQLEELGFEIGCHSVDHPNLLQLSTAKVREQVVQFDRACAEHGIAKSTSFSYPGGHFDRRTLAILKELGYLTARRGRDPERPLQDHGGNGRAYDPREDDPFLIPSTLTRGSGAKEDERIRNALDLATAGNVAVLTYHGVPDVYRHCSVSVERFRKDMKFLGESGATVIALRDLSRYVDLARRPADAFSPIVKRLGLRVEYPRCNACGTVPAFSWKTVSNGWDQKQAAYRILVASSEAHLDRNRGDLWDSGKVHGDRRDDVDYDGSALQPGKEYWWKVQVWNRRSPEEIARITPYQSEELVTELRKSRPGPFSEAERFTTKGVADHDPLKIPDTDDGLPGAGPLRRSEWFRGVWRKRRESWLDKTEAQRTSVVFLGDSITQGWGDDFKGAFGQMKIANRGITGDTSRGLLVRLKEDVLALDPRAVVLMIGANDLAEKATGKIVFGNVMLIVEALKAHNPAMPIVLCETFPCAPDNYRPVAEIRKINALYAKTWSGDPQVTIVKTYRLFAGSDGASRSEYLPDRVHPNEAGYALWAGALRPVFARLGFGDPTPDPPSN
jgi:peptidoglycan/xylan/chitin deacetylase (PgdA/CDA1 family)/lysophospholipase L1-like esterase